jgi:rhamnose transport system substrate-binding protein
MKLVTTAYGDDQSDKSYRETIWNPIDLGYTTTQIAYNLIKGTVKGVPGDEVPAGRMGKVKVGPDGVVVMAEPFTFDKSNVAEYAKVF